MRMFSLHGKQALVDKTKSLLSNAKLKETIPQLLDFSMALLNASMLNEKILYDETKALLLKEINLNQSKSIEENIETIKKHPKPTLVAWVIGRVVMAANTINDIETAKYYSELLDTFLKDKSIDNDAFKTWAGGYLLGYYANTNNEKYIATKIKVEESTNVLIQTNNNPFILWALVMNLQAAAFAKDEEFYNGIVDQMKSQTGKDSLADAIQTMPTQNYPAWATAITMYSATLMKKDITQLNIVLDNALKTESAEFDKLLGKTIKLTSDEIIEENDKQEKTIFSP